MWSRDPWAGHQAVTLLLTCLVVMHPVQNDFWGSVPARNHVASHFSISVSGQAKIQDLQFTKGKGRRKGRKEKSYRQARIYFQKETKQIQSDNKEAPTTPQPPMAQFKELTGLF